MSQTAALSKLLRKNLAQVTKISPPLGARALQSVSHVDLLNPQKCHEIIDRLNLENEYKHTNIIDMNPGFGLWSQILNERLQPRSHILLEPLEYFHQHLKDRYAKSKNNMQIVNLDGYDWTSYSILLGGKEPNPDKPLLEPGYIPPILKKLPPESGINNDILFIGNMTRLKYARRVVSQLVDTCFVDSWLQQFGRVRFLLWVVDADKERLLPRAMQSRGRPSVIVDTVCDVTEVAGSGTVRTGKGFQKPAEVNPSKRPSTKIVGRTYEEKLSIKVQRSIEKWKKMTETSEMSPKSVHYKGKALKAADNLRSEIGLYLSYREGVVLIDGPEGTFADTSLPDLLARYEELKGQPKVFEPDETITPEQRTSYSVFEEDYLLSVTTDRGRQNSLEDEEYARSLSPALLQAWLPRNQNPITIDTKDDSLYPKRHIALLDFKPKKLDEYFVHSNPEVARMRLLTFTWIVRALFSLRAQGVRMSLKSLVSGGEYLLDEIPDGKGKALGDKRVRCLTVDEFISLAKAWDSWPFKPIDEEWGGYSQVEAVSRDAKRT